jgi:hypothetical protein
MIWSRKLELHMDTGALWGLKEKPVEGRCGPATVMGSKSKQMPLGIYSGKAWRRNDPKARRTACIAITVLPASDGEAICTILTCAYYVPALLPGLCMC